MLEGIVKFFNPDTPEKQKQKQGGGQQQQQQVKQTGGQQQQQQQQVKVQMPPLKETSSLFEPVKKQFQESDQLTDAIVQQVNKQAQQSRQQVAQAKKQQLSEEKIQQVQKAHEQILGYARQIRTLLSQIREMRQTHLTRQQQVQQNRRRIKKAEQDAVLVVGQLRDLLEQIAVNRQQSRRAQLSHIRQLQQLKTNLLAEEFQPIQQRINKKMIQYDTPQGNKVRVQLSVHPDSKCCVAQSLAQKTRLHLRPLQTAKILV